MPGCPFFKKQTSSLALASHASWERDDDLPVRAGVCRRSQPFEKSTSVALSLPVTGFSFRLFSSIDQAAGVWTDLERGENAFLSEAYLRALEETAPNGITPFYALIYKEEKPAVLVYLQLIDFRADQSLQQPQANSRTGRLLQVIRKQALKLLRFRLLHLGNALLTGPRAYTFDPRLVQDQEVQTLLSASLPALRQAVRNLSGLGADVYLVKDIPLREAMGPAWRSHRFREWCFLPNMIFYIDRDWQSFDDYLASLQSKYRVRARRAFRLLDGVESRELSRKEIRQFRETIYDLYVQVARSVDFNMADLHPRYFESLKEELGDAFHLVGYFKDGQMVGFYTTMENGEELEAHFIGFDAGANREYQLYLNMLYEMIRDGIALGASYISFARTAMEIKSSVGAVAEQYQCYIRARSPLVNLFVRPLIRLLEPRQEWEPRHPFK